jgi:hypothetical protein
MRHKRSQNTGVVYTLVDEVVAVVDVLMSISSHTRKLEPRSRIHWTIVIGDTLVSVHSLSSITGFPLQNPRRSPRTGLNKKANNVPLGMVVS